MAARGLEILCFHSRYYIIYHPYGGYHLSLGADLVKRIPEDPGEYQKWLASMRAEFAAVEAAYEDEVFTVRPGERQGVYSSRVTPHLDKYVDIPTALPRLDMYDAEEVYILNLDAEVLTMGFSVHWRMDRIPRADSAWLSALTTSNYRGLVTVDPGRCPESCLASLVVPRPRPVSGSGTAADPMRVEGVRRLAVRGARTQLDGHDQVWRALAASEVWTAYGRQLGRFGRQWLPQDLPFRELVFALVSLAAGRQTAFCSYAPPDRSPPSSPADQADEAPPCHPRNCCRPGCQASHLFFTAGWLEPHWLVGGDEEPSSQTEPSQTTERPLPLLDFGSPAHYQGQPPGAAPLETTYWLTDDVLVSLTLTVDGAAVAKAMDWGRAQRGAKNQGGGSGGGGGIRHHRPADRFYMVVLSLFHVVFAEVSEPDSAAPETDEKKEESDGMPDLLLSSVLPLSPLTEETCLSTHPRERPAVPPDGRRLLPQPHESMSKDSYARSVSQIRDDFSGIAALVHFVAAVDSRRAATGGAAWAHHGRLPPELYADILDVVDYATWKECLLVSPLLRSLGLARYRLDDRRALVGGPGTTLRHVDQGKPVLTFKLRDLSTGQTETVLRARKSQYLDNYGWMPILGSGPRRAVMLDVELTFEPAERASERQQERAERAEREKREAAAHAARVASGDSEESDSMEYPSSPEDFFLESEDTESD